MISPTVRYLVGLACLLAPSLTACSDASGPEGIPVVQLSPDSATIAVGDTFQAILVPMLPPGYVPRVDWSSSDPGITTVTPTSKTTARIKGIQPGEALIRVGGEGRRDSLHVRVTEGGP